MAAAGALFDVLGRARNEDKNVGENFVYVFGGGCGSFLDRM